MKRAYAYLILILAIAFAISPAFTTPFSGFSVDQLPIPQIDPPIQPAGYAFSVWGLIYSWLIVSAVFGAIKRSEAQDWTRARIPLGLSLAVGVPWLAIANSSAIWATITIVIMAIGAVSALLVAPSRDRWWFQAPVGVYAGWLTAASCVSIGTTMAGYDVLTDQFGWAYIGVAIALVVSVLVYVKNPTAPEYLITIIWALVGVIVANATVNQIIASFAAWGCVMLIGVIILSRKTRALQGA